MEYSQALIYGLGLLCLFVWFLNYQARRARAPRSFESDRKTASDTLVAVIVTVSIIFLLVLAVWL